MASAGQIMKLCAQVSESSPEQLLSLGVEAPRSLTLAAGAAMISGILAGFSQRELRISSRGLREGVLVREHSRRAPIQAA